MKIFKVTANQEQLCALVEWIAKSNIYLSVKDVHAIADFVAQREEHVRQMCETMISGLRP